MMNNRWFCAFVLSLVALFFVACDDEVSYSEMKDREKGAIRAFIENNGIKVIKKSDFIKADSVTDVSNNEFVQLGDVYAQFVCNPKHVEGAKKVEDGTGLDLLVYFTEYSIMDEDTLATNNHGNLPSDEMRVDNESGSYTASLSSNSEWYAYYGTTAVPSGWLAVMPYLYFARHTAADKLAHVRLIVPHTSGTTQAATYVYPCFYDITFQVER